MTVSNMYGSLHIELSSALARDHGHACCLILVLRMCTAITRDCCYDVRMNRAALHACDRDSKDKFHAQNLDDRMQQLRNSSQGIGFHPGIENVDNT